MFAHWNPHQGVNPILRKATLEIPLLDSVLPTKGSAPMSFTRASVRRELDYSGLFVELLSGEVGFRGARRVENLIATAAPTGFSNATTPLAAVAPPSQLPANTPVYKLTENTANSVHWANWATAFLTINNLHLIEIYFKAAERTRVTFYTGGNVPGFAGRVNLLTGAIESGSNLAVQNCGDGWWRVCGRGTPNATGTSLVYIQLATDAGVGTYTGDGASGVYACAPQVEDVAGQSNQNPSEYVSVGAPKANYLIHTDDVTISPWGTANQLARAETPVVCDGRILRASQIVATAATVKLQNVASFPATSLVYTIYAKKGSGATDLNSFAVYNASTAANICNLTFDYDTGVITQTVGSGATAEDRGNGVWKITMPVSAGIAVGNSLNFYAGATGNVETAGEWAYFGGTQVVVGTTPPETYTPVGNAYPFHGAMVDGVKWFTYENGNTVNGNVVTEARGPDIPYPQVLKGYTPMPAATNLLTYANDLSNAAWTAVNATKPQATQWPRLRPEALPFRIVDDATAGAPHGVSRTAGTTITANTNYCLWVLVHSSGERFRGFLQLVDAATGTSGFYASFNARTGAVATGVSGTGTVAGSGYINIAKGWGIVYVSGKIDAASTSAVAKLFTLDDAGNLVRDGDGTSAMIVDHFQLEFGTIPTNIIPTTSAAVTISTDSLTCPSAGLIGATGGSMSIEGSSQINDGATDRYLVNIDDGTVSERHGLIYRFTGAGGFASVDGGVAQANISTTNSVAADGHLKLAARFAENNFAVVMNSGDVATDTSGTMPTVSVIRFGSVVNGGYNKGPVSYFRAWDSLLTDAELKAITANGYRDETINFLTGWNDSSFISRDGRRLYFTYTPLFPYPFLQTQDYSYAPNGPTRRGSPGYTSIENSFDLYCAHLRHDGTVERIECLNLNTATDSHFACMEFMGSPWRMYVGYMNDGQTETRMRSASIDANGKWTFNATSEFAAIHAGGADLGFNDDNPHVVLGTVCVFASGRTTGAVGGTDIWLATRAAIGDPWGSPVNPGVINTLGNEDQFYMHSNMVDCYFSRDGEIWHVTWNGGGFNNDASKVTFAVSPALIIGECSIPDDFSYLYFTQIDQTTGVSRIMRAPWTGSKTAWGAPVAVD
jgi:hypothetical protein